MFGTRLLLAAVALASVIGLSACGDSMGERAVTGGLIGGTGGYVLGGTKGAVIGGAAGAGVGAATAD